MVNVIFCVLIILWLIRIYAVIEKYALPSHADPVLKVLNWDLET